jgi:outer membrane protein assembly factor BamB
VIEDQVITTSGNTAYALNRHTGKVLWQRTISSQNLIPAGAIGNHVYLKGTNRLYAPDRTTGTDIWTFGVTNIVTLPAIAGEQIYIVTRTGGQAQLRALNRSDGQEIWQIVNVRLANAAPVVANGRVYVRTVDGRVLVYGVNLAGAGLNGIVRVWDAATNQELLTLTGPGANSVIFTPDNKQLAVARHDGTVRLYVLPIEELVDLAQSRVTRPLTTEECQQFLYVDECPASP